MKKRNKKIGKFCSKIIFTIVVFLLFFVKIDMLFAKTIDVNGIEVSLNVETNKKEVGVGRSVKDTNEYSEKEYDEEKEIEDKSVKVTLNIKNVNPYEEATVNIKKKDINGGFKLKERNSKSSLKLKKGESEEVIYEYSYHKNFLREQFNSLFYDKNSNVDNIDDNLSYTDNKNKKFDIDDENKILNNDDKKNKNTFNSNIILILLIGIVVIFLLVVFYMTIFKNIKDVSDDFDNGINVIILTIILSLLISICFNKNIAYANQEYEPIIYEKSKNFTKTITESVSFNGRLYNFSYEISVKFSNNNEVIDKTVDTDGDGLLDYLEYTYMTDLNNPDTDGDGLSDYLEVVILNYNPNSKWTFGDGMNDGYRDFDGDGLRNIKELEIGTDITSRDTDGDGLTDYEEYSGILSKDGRDTYYPDPLMMDTDEDGLSDYVEIKLGLDPTNEKTDGVTLDSERRIEQDFNISVIPNNLREGDIVIKKVSGEVKGDINDNFKITEYYANNLDNVTSIVSSTFNVSNESGDEIEVSFDATNVADRIENLVLVKFVDGKMVPIDTTFDGNTITSKIDNGIYGVVDSDYILRDLNIHVADYLP